jgi:hypothetical protein
LCYICFVGESDQLGVVFHNAADEMGYRQDAEKGCQYKNEEACVHFCLTMYHQKWEIIQRLFGHREDFKAMADAQSGDEKQDLKRFFIWMGSPYFHSVSFSNGAALFLAAGGIYGGAMPNGDLTHPEWLFLRRAGDL